MLNDAITAVPEQEATNDVRLFVSIAWIAGPTAMFVGWFLQSLFAGSQIPNPSGYPRQTGLLLLFAFITSIPLVIVSLIGVGAAIFSDRLSTMRRLNVMALIWSMMVFALYFGLFGAVGTLSKDGFPITVDTMVSLVIIVALSLAVPIILFLVVRRRITHAGALTASQPATPAASVES